MKKQKQVVQIDSREKRNQHITDRFADRSIDFLVSKLPFGDYWNWCNPFVVVERKFGIIEVVRTLGTSHDQFLKELKAATKHGVHMILLIEAEQGFFDLEDIVYWKNPYTDKNPRAMQGITLYKILKKYCEYYDFEVQFTTKENSADRILELLKAV